MDLPNLNWLMDSRDKQGTSMTFTGSRRFDTAKPCFDSPSFNYWVKIEGGVLKARANRTEGALGRFAAAELASTEAELSEEGLAEVNAWLDKLYEETVQN